MLLLYAISAGAQFSIPGPDAMDQRPRTISDQQYRAVREQAMRSREEDAAALPPGMDKSVACAEYRRRLDEIAVHARGSGDALYKDLLNELRRRIQAAQFSAGC